MTASCDLPGDKLTSYKCCLAATREFVRVFQDHDCAGMILPMLYLVLCDQYDEARVHQRFGEVLAKEWRIKDARVALAMSWFMERVRWVETPDGLVPVLQEEEPNKEEFLRRQVESNKLLPREQRRGPGTTNTHNLRRYLDRAISDHGALIAKWRDALLRGSTRREAEAETLLSEYSGQSF